MFETGLSTRDGSVSVELCNPTVLVGGDLAIVEDCWDAGHQAEPTFFDSDAAALALQQSGSRRIVQDFCALPMLMDGSDQVALDRKPS